MPRFSHVVPRGCENDSLRSRFAACIRQRAAPITLTVLLELLLVLAILGLGIGLGTRDQRAGEVLTTFAVPDEPPPLPEPPHTQPSAAAPARPAPAPAAPPPSASASFAPVVLPLAPIVLPVTPPTPAAVSPPGEAAVETIAPTRSEAPGTRGAAGAAGTGDSERIAGNGGDGEALYMAEWYRKPTPEDFRRYIARVRKPGWAVIDCRTRPLFRVDRCVLVEEGPAGSNTGRALLEASWHFKVRPPRVGGRSMVGERVRIRIDFRLLGG